MERKKRPSHSTDLSKDFSSLLASGLTNRSLPQVPSVSFLPAIRTQKTTISVTMISICRYTQNKQTEWDDFVKVSKNGTFLFLRAYMDYHSDRFHDHSLMYYNEKNKLIAVLPANIKTASTLTPKLSTLNSQPSTLNSQPSTLHSHQGLTYGGFVLSPEIHISEVGELFRLTISYLKENGICEWNYKQIPYIYHLIPSQEEDYWLWRYNATQKACNMMTVIDFKSAINDISSSRKRTYFNKLNRQGYTVIFDADIRDFWPILEDNLMERFSSHPVHSLSEIELLKQRFPDNIVCCTVKNPEGITIAGTLLFITQQVVRTQYISASHEGKRSNALDYLMLTLIRHYGNNPQYRYFEFGTSMAEDGINLNEGLILQKEGFGGRAVACKIFTINIQ